jgi:hypothetical protein
LKEDFKSREGREEERKKLGSTTNKTKNVYN